MTVRKEYEFDIMNDCWSGAKDRVDSLTPDLADRLADLLDDSELWGDDIPTETDVNDFIWFEDDTYAEWLGFEDSDKLWKYCDLVNKGTDEDDIWLDDDGELVTIDEINDRYKEAEANEEFDEGDYNSPEEWAEDMGYEKFELD